MGQIFLFHYQNFAPTTRPTLQHVHILIRRKLTGERLIQIQSWGLWMECKIQLYKKLNTVILCEILMSRIDRKTDALGNQWEAVDPNRLTNTHYPTTENP